MTQQPRGGPSRSRVAVFCGRGENTARATTVLDTARVMAGRGLRVLVVCVHSAGFSAATYLSTRFGGLRDAGPDGPRARTQPERWTLPDGDGTVPLWLLTLPDAGALARLPAHGETRRATPFAGFDRVLVDAPVPRGADQVAALARLADVVAACFPPQTWAVDDVADLVGDLRRYAGRPLDVVAVGIHADARLSEQLRHARDQVRAALRGPGADGPAPYVEIPHHEGGDVVRPAPAGSGGTGPADPPLPPPRRDGPVRLADLLDAPRTAVVRRVTLVHQPRALAWADWTSRQLTAAGAACTPVPLAEFSGEGPFGDGMLLVLAPVGATADQIHVLARLAHPETRVVLVDGDPLPPQLGHHEQIDLRTADEAEAAALLTGALRLPAPEAALLRPVPFPRLPDRHNLPPRATAFTGRDALCEDLRGLHGSGGEPPAPVRITGAPGIGKSALALEYCHRFGGGHDTVWWIPSDDRAGVERSLADLARRAGLPDWRSGPREVLRWLEAGDCGSWLLVYDNADDPAYLEGLLPACGPGRRVLVTSRTGAGPGGPRIEVPVLTRDESRSMLAAAVPGLGAAADQVSQVLGRSPLGLLLAGAWLRTEAGRARARNATAADALTAVTGTLLGRIASKQEELLSGLDRVPLHRVMLEVTLDGLSGTGNAGVWQREGTGERVLEWLLECCALLAPSGADPALLRSPVLWAAARQVPGGAPGSLPSDPLVADAALWALARYGLLDVRFGHLRSPGRPDSGEAPVRQVRILRELVLDRMTPAAREERERAVRAAIAGHRGPHRPPDHPPERVAARTRRMLALRLWSDDRPDVRRALLDHLSHLVARGDKQNLREALTIAHRATDEWKPTGTPSPEYLRLSAITAAAHRNLGGYRSAAQSALVALRGYRVLYGIDHPLALRSADSYGAILRAEGELTEARIEGSGVVAAMEELVGPDHEATVRTEHNLALAEALSGRPRRALELLHGRWTRRLALGGPEDPGALQLLDTLAMAHRCLGQNRESRDLLKGYLHHVGGRPDAESLSAEIGLAVSERRLHRPEWARERDQRVLDVCRTLLGEEHLRTQRCRFSLAADLGVLGEHDAAVAVQGECLGHLKATLGTDHPYTHVCRVRAGVHLRNAGDLDRALAAGRSALNGLTERPGPNHPWVAAAQVALANTLVGRGQYDEALERDREARRTLEDLELTRHPDYGLVLRNHEATAALLGRGPGPRTAARGDIDLELPGV